MNIEEKFDNNTVDFIIEYYKDGGEIVRNIIDTDVLSFDVWLMLTQANGAYKEVRIRVATDEEIKKWK